MKSKITSWVVIVSVMFSPCLMPVPASAYVTPAKPIIFHIQTAHGNYEAQKDIQSILHDLRRRYGVKTLLLEGTASKLNSESLNFFPNDPGLTLKVADNLMKKSLVKGSELFLLETKDAEAYGIENLELCVRNGKALMSVYAQKEKTDTFLKSLDAKIQKQCQRHFSSELRNFLKETEKSVDARGFSHLAKKAQKHLDLDFNNPRIQLDWPMTFRIMLLMEFKSSFQPEFFKKEKKEFRKAFQSDDSEDSFKRLMLSLPVDFDFSKYPQINTFVSSSIIEKEINGPALFEESAKLRNLIAEKMADTPESRETLRLIRDSKLLRKLFSLELTPEEYEAIKQKDFSSLLEPKMMGVFYQAMEFYDLARLRDSEMLSNIQKHIKSGQKEPVAVITGGFHSEPFKQYFEKGGYRYVQITPSVSSSDGKQSYIDSIFKTHLVTASTWETPYPLTAPKPELMRQGINFRKVDQETKAVIAASLGTAPLEIYMVQVDPDIYGIHYEINAHMNVKNPIDKKLAVKQWHDLLAILRGLGIQVNAVPQKVGSPDMVFAANAGYADGRYFIPTHFTHKQRQGETPHNIEDLKKLGFEVIDIIDKNLTWEGEGDMLPYGKKRLFGGYGHRSEVAAHQIVADFLQKDLSVLELVDDRFYHLDTCFFPLSDGKTVLYFPGAFTEEGRAEILKHVENPIAVTEEDAMYFVCNGVSFGKRIVVNKASDELKAVLREKGFDVIETPMSEYLKSGGSVKCTVLTMESWNHGAPRDTESTQAKSLGRTYIDLTPKVTLSRILLTKFTRFFRGNVLPLGLPRVEADQILAQLGFPKPIVSIRASRALFVVRDASVSLNPEFEPLFQLAKMDPKLKIVIWAAGTKEIKHLLPNLSVKALPQNVNSEIDQWITSTKSPAGLVAPDNILEKTAFRGGLVKAQVLASQSADEQNLTAILLAKKLQNIGKEPQDPFFIYTGQTLAGSEGFWQDLLADLTRFRAFQVAA